MICDLAARNSRECGDPFAIGFTSAAQKLVLRRKMTILMVALGLALPSPERGSYVAHRASERSRWAVVRPYNAKLERMAQCESGGRWWINTGNGYYGGLQFDHPTWRSVGGWGYPHQNTKLEQKYRAVKLIKRRGYRPWPRCGYA